MNIKSPIRFTPGVKDLRVVVRSVCKKCNETWMSGLQNNAKPVIEALLEETATALNAEECKPGVAVARVRLLRSSLLRKWLVGLLSRRFLPQIVAVFRASSVEAR